MYRTEIDKVNSPLRQVQVHVSSEVSPGKGLILPGPFFKVQYTEPKVQPCRRSSTSAYGKREGIGVQM